MSAHKVQRFYCGKKVFNLCAKLGRLCGMAGDPSDKTQKQSLALRSGDNPTDSLGKRFRQTWDFTTIAITEHTEQSRWYKMVSIVLNLVSIVGIVIGIVSGHWWLSLIFAALLQCSLFYSLHTVRLYHERKAQEKDELISNIEEQTRAQIASLNERISALEERLKPKLEIKCQDRESFVQTAYGARIIKILVENTGGSPLTGVHVNIEGLTTEHIQYRKIGRAHV